jgi:hypothetical protein
MNVYIYIHIYIHIGDHTTDSKELNDLIASNANSNSRVVELEGLIAMQGCELSGPYITVFMYAYMCRNMIINVYIYICIHMYMYINTYMYMYISGLYEEIKVFKSGGMNSPNSNSRVVELEGLMYMKIYIYIHKFI